MNLKDLRAWATEHNIEGRSKMNKADLLAEYEAWFDAWGPLTKCTPERKPEDYENALKAVVGITMDTLRGESPFEPPAEAVELDDDAYYGDLSDMAPTVEPTPEDELDPEGLACKKNKRKDKEPSASLTSHSRAMRLSGPGLETFAEMLDLNIETDPEGTQEFVDLMQGVVDEHRQRKRSKTVRRTRRSRINKRGF